MTVHDTVILRKILDLLTVEINETYFKAFPLKTKYVGTKRFEKPWLTGALLNSIKAKSKYFKQYKLGFIQHEHYRCYRNTLTTTIRKAKENYFKTAFDGCHADMKKTWLLIKRLINRNNPKKSIKSVVVDDDELNDDADISEAFSKYFSTVANTLEESIPISDRSAIDYLRDPVCPSLFLKPIDLSECSQIISSLRNKACSNREIPVQILKRIKPFIIAPICSLINLSIECATFPNPLKLATITNTIIFKRRSYAKVVEIHFC